MVIVAAVVVALGADSAIWWIAGRKIETALGLWVQQRRAQGFQVAIGAERVVGWPRAAVVRVAGLSLSGGEALVPGGLRWHATELTLTVRLLAPRWLEVAPSGLQQLRISHGPMLALAASRLEAKLGLGGHQRIIVTGKNVSAGPAALDPRLVTIDTFSVMAMPSKTGARAELTAGRELLEVEANGVGFGGGLFKGLRPRVNVLSADVALIGPKPSGPDWAKSLATWRDAGGMIAFRSFSLVSGPLAIGGSGRLELDQSLQPAGQGRARIVGFVAALDRLAAGGIISDGEATAAKAVMMLLARPSHEGGPPEVDVPLRLKDSTLSVGRIPLVRVPKVHWPAAAPKSVPPV